MRLPLRYFLERDAQWGELSTESPENIRQFLTEPP